MLDDQHSRYHQHGGRRHAARPRAGLAAPALTQDVRHGLTANSVLICPTTLSYDHTPACGNLAHPRVAPGRPYPAVPDLVRATLIAPIWTASRTHMTIGTIKTGDDLAEWW